MTIPKLPIARDGFNPAPYDWLGHCPQKVAAIIRSACERNEVSVRHLMLGRKTRAVTRARWDACAELRAMHWGSAEHPGGPRQGPSHARPSLPQIGLWLHLHHTSVLHGIRRAGVPDDHDRPSPRRGLCYSAHVVAEPRCAWRAYS